MKQCKGKMSFRTKRFARLHIRRIRGKTRRLVAYKCPHCGSFHVGHWIPDAAE